MSISSSKKLQEVGIDLSHFDDETKSKIEDAVELLAAERSAKAIERRYTDGKPNVTKGQIWWDKNHLNTGDARINNIIIVKSVNKYESKNRDYLMWDVSVINWFDTFGDYDSKTDVYPEPSIRQMILLGTIQGFIEFRKLVPLL